VIEATGITRACVAGGDTSGHVVPELDVDALEFEAPIAPGTPLCTAHGEGAFDGLELALKGGQVETGGDEADFFGAVRDGVDAG